MNFKEKSYNKKRSFKSEKGITLVALAVTMIVLAILLGITIRMVASNESVVKQAQVTKQKDDISKLQERIELWKSNNNLANLNRTGEETPKEFIDRLIDEGIITLENVTGNTITLGNYTVDLNAEYTYGGEYLIDYVEIGDYVKYTPDGTTSTYTIPTDDRTWIWNDTDKDNAYDSGEETITRQSTTWRVFKKDGGSVVLISASPIEHIYLYGTEAYNNGDTRLNEICNTLYGGTKGIARSLNVDDLNKISGFDANNEENWMYKNVENVKVNVPKGIRTVGELENYLGISLEHVNSPDGNNDLSSYIPNYYFYNSTNFQNSVSEENMNTYNTLLKNKKSWLASKLVYANFYPESSYCGFNMFFIQDISLSNTTLTHSYEEDNQKGFGCPIRPIVVLNSNIKVTNPAAGGDTSAKAWEIQ